MARPTRATQWCGTLNNWSTDELELFQHIVTDDGPIKYLIFGLEIGEMLTPHLQWYLKLKATNTMQFVKRLLGGRVHLESCKGSALQNITYCKKDGDYYEFGTVPPGSGKRTDLDSLHADLKAGVSMKEISNTHFHPYLKYGRSIESWRCLNSAVVKRSQPKILWLYGASGTGKSLKMERLIEDHLDETFCLSAGVTGCWWTGYSAQRIVVMDDLRASWMPHSQLLRVLDSHPHRVAVHGGNVPLVADKFIITTNDPPHMLYEKDPSGAFMRRIHEWAWVIEVGEDCGHNVEFPTAYESEVFHL